jgi:sugar phosphate isomerase/epimerase
MKLSYSTLASPNWSWSKAIQAAQAYGYDGVEWRLIDGETVSAQFPLARCQEIRAAVEAAGLRTCALDSGVSLAYPPGADRERNLAEAEGLLRVAQGLGTDILRVFPGKYPQSVSDDQAINWVVEGLNYLLPHAKATGVRIALEIHDSFEWNRRQQRGTTTSNFLVQVLEQVPAPEVGVQWDLGNPYLEGESAGQTWQNLPKDRLIYVHTKDMRPTAEGKWEYVAMGAGVIPLAGIIGWLKASNFDGWLSFEWEKKWHPELAEPEEALPQYIAFMRRLLA